MRATFLKDKGYTPYPQRAPGYEHKTLWQKRIDNESVCETNDKLFINISEYLFSGMDITFEVSITAEKNGVWWDLKCYSLNFYETENRLEEIENALIKMFNTL